MPFDPTDPNSFASQQFTSPLAGMAQDRATGMLNQPQMRRFAQPTQISIQDAGTNFASPIMPTQAQIGSMMPGTLAMAKGGRVANKMDGDELASIKETIRKEFSSRGLDFDKFVSNPAVMDEVGKSIAAQGQNGDTILAHINPEEAALLKKHGGSGTINPHTGLPQFEAWSAAGAADAYGGSWGGSSYSGSTRDSSSSNQSPSYGGSSTGWSGGSGGGRDTSYSNYIGGSDLGGYSGTGNTTYSGSSGGGNDSGSALSGFTGGGTSPSGTGTGILSPTAPSLSSSDGGGWTPTSGNGSTQNIVSPLGVNSPPVSLGSTQPIAAPAATSQPSFDAYDPMSGIPIGGVNFSPLSQLASGVNFNAPQAPATVPTSGSAEGGIDTSISPTGMSNIDFTNMNAGMYQGANMPGGISNFGADPSNPGYTDIGVTAMRMAAGMPGGEGYRSQSTEFNLGKLGEFDPVAQTQAGTILNRMMDQGYAPGFDPMGVGRTFAEQAALKANAGQNLTAEPGRSFHNYGLAMDVENLPEQGYRDLSRIAQEEGWGWGESQDPAHVQMAPWGAGAMQTAQNLGAQPFTGATRVASAEPSTLSGALNTVSNIAAELFGTKSAQAEEAPAPSRDYLGDMMEQASKFGGEEIMSPFVGTQMGLPPVSQQQMLDVLGIQGSPVAPQRAPLSNMFGASPYGESAFGDVIPQSGFTLKEQGRAPSAPATPIMQSTLADIIETPQSGLSFGLPENMASFGATEEPFAYGIGEGALGAFGLSGISNQYVAPGVIGGGEGGQEMAGMPSLEGLPPGRFAVFDMPTAIAQFRQQLMGITVPSGLGFNVNAGAYANPPESNYYQNDAQIAQTIMQNLPLAGLTIGPDGVIVNRDGSMATPEQIAQVMSLASKSYTAPSSAFPEGSTGTMTLEPSQFVDIRNIPLPPERPALQTAADTTLASGITIPPTDIYGARAEIPSFSTSPMTTEQLKDFGVYREPFAPGETVRDNFNEAYADARSRGLQMFSWTNPVTGKSDIYNTDLGGESAQGPLSTYSGNSTSGSGGGSTSGGQTTNNTTPPPVPTPEPPKFPSYAERMRNLNPSDYERYAYNPEHAFYS